MTNKWPLFKMCLDLSTSLAHSRKPGASDTRWLLLQEVTSRGSQELYFKRLHSTNSTVFQVFCVIFKVVYCFFFYHKICTCCVKDL